MERLLHEPAVQSTEYEEIMKVLIATDGSPSSARAAETFCRLASEWKDLSVRVLSVYETQVPMAAVGYAVSSDYFAQLGILARERATDIASKCSSSIRAGLNGDQVKIEPVAEMGRPARAIVESAEEWGADLIVLGSHGHGFWSRLTLGSVADQVIHHAPCSVLVVK
jgi:nucleotide-binding universal stress UspA family protein